MHLKSFYVLLYKRWEEANWRNKCRVKRDIWNVNSIVGKAMRSILTVSENRFESDSMQLFREYS